MTQLDKPKRKINPKSLANLKAGHQWKPGESGNPSGKSKSHFDVAKHSRKSGPVVVKFWKAVMQDEKMPIGQRMRASENLMNRGYGKALEPLHLRADVNFNHRSAHLDALKLVNGEAENRRLLELAKQNGKEIDGKAEMLPHTSTKPIEPEPSDQEYPFNIN